MKTLILFLHITAGGTALVTGLLAMLVRKRAQPHTSPGTFYFAAMAGVFITGLYLSVVGNNLFLLLVSVFSFYMALSGYRARALRHRQQAPWLDWSAAGLMVLFGAGLVGWGLWLWAGRGEAFGAVALVFGGVGLSYAYSDASRFRQLGQASWLRPHIRGMVGSYIAATTAFLVNNVQTGPAVLWWLLPTVVLSPLIAYWMRKYAPARAKKGNLTV